MNFFDLFDLRKQEAFEEIQALRSSQQTNDYYRKLNQANLYPTADAIQGPLNIIGDDAEWSDLAKEVISLTSKLERVVGVKTAKVLIQYLVGTEDEVGRANIFLLNDSWHSVESALRSEFKKYTSTRGVYLFLVKYLEQTFGANYAKTAQKTWQNADRTPDVPADLNNEPTAATPPPLPTQPAPPMHEPPPVPMHEPPPVPMHEPPPGPVRIPRRRRGAAFNEDLRRAVDWRENQRMEAIDEQYFRQRDREEREEQKQQEREDRRRNAEMEREEEQYFRDRGINLRPVRDRRVSDINIVQ
jgi:hypothetical protein